MTRHTLKTWWPMLAIALLSGLLVATSHGQITIGGKSGGLSSNQVQAIATATVNTTTVTNALAGATLPAVNLANATNLPAASLNPKPYVLVWTNVVIESASSITLTGWPTNYYDIEVQATLQATNSNGNIGNTILVNGDAGSNYAWLRRHTYTGNSVLTGTNVGAVASMNSVATTGLNSFPAQSVLTIRKYNQPENHQILISGTTFDPSTTEARFTDVVNFHYSAAVVTSLVFSTTSIYTNSKFTVLLKNPVP